MTALRDDELAPEPAGSMATVDELLAALGVAEAGLDAQRAAVQRFAGLPGVGPIVEALRPDLERASLI